MKIEFEETAHVYRLDGAVVPSVTQVLSFMENQQWVGVPHETIERARQLGNNVHLACHLFNRGELDWSTLDPQLVPYVQGWERFLTEKSATVIASETRVAHPKLGYAGTIDTLLDVRNYDWLVDIKTGQPTKAWGPQTAGYADCLGSKKLRRYCVRLFGDGTYKLIPFRNSTDHHIFVSMLNIYRWMEKG